MDDKKDHLRGDPLGGGQNIGISKRFNGETDVNGGRVLVEGKGGQPEQEQCPMYDLSHK